MGIFGDLGDFLGGIASGPLGQVGAQILLDRERARNAPRIAVPVGFPGTGVPSIPRGPIGGPPIRAGSGLPLPVRFGPPGVVPDRATFGAELLPVGALPVPGPIDFGLDPTTPSFFKPSKATVRPIRFLTQTNPVSGEMAFWEHAGQPILFSRDLRVCKRVARIASRSKLPVRRLKSGKKA